MDDLPSWYLLFVRHVVNAERGHGARFGFANDRLGAEMTRFSLLHALHLVLFLFALELAVAPEPALAQAIPSTAPCQNDPRFVRILGVYQGKPICEWTGTGTATDGSIPATISQCTSVSGQTVENFGGYPYCIWSHRGFYLASILYDPGSMPLPPDNILFPTPQGPANTPPMACTQDPRFQRVLGTWRGVTLCHWSGSGVLDPLPDNNCPGTNYPSGRVRVYPDDFGDAPPPGVNNYPPAGTRFCVTSPPFWDQRGNRAAIMARQPTRFDLAVDTHLARPLPPAGGPALFRIWIGSAAMIPAGSELVVTGSLTPGHYFMPMSAAGQGWTCTGNWGAFSCRRLLAGAMTTPVLLEIPALYPPTSAGLYVTYSAAATMADNIDPLTANNMMAIGTNLY